MGRASFRGQLLTSTTVTMFRAIIGFAILSLAFSMKIGRSEPDEMEMLLEKFIEKIAVGGGGEPESKNAYRVNAKIDVSDHGTIRVTPKIYTDQDVCMTNGEGCWYSAAIIQEGSDGVWSPSDIFEHKINNDEETLFEFMDLSPGVYDVKVCRIVGPGDETPVNDRCNCWECAIKHGMPASVWSYRGCNLGQHCDVF